MESRVFIPIGNNGWLISTTLRNKAARRPQPALAAAAGPRLRGELEVRPQQTAEQQQPGVERTSTITDLARRA